MVKAVYLTGETITEEYSLLENGTYIYAMGPDNPSTSLIPFTIERVKGKEAVFVHLFSSSEKAKPQQHAVSMKLLRDSIVVAVDGDTYAFDR